MLYFSKDRFRESFGSQDPLLSHIREAKRMSQLYYERCYFEVAGTFYRSHTFPVNPYYYIGTTILYGISDPQLIHMRSSASADIICDQIFKNSSMKSSAFLHVFNDISCVFLYFSNLRIEFLVVAM